MIPRPNCQNTCHIPRMNVYGINHRFSCKKRHTTNRKRFSEVVWACPSSQIRFSIFGTHSSSLLVHKSHDHFHYNGLGQFFKSDDRRCSGGPKARDGTSGQVENVSSVWGRHPELHFADANFATVSFLCCQLNIQAILKIFSQLIPTRQKVFK